MGWNPGEAWLIGTGAGVCGFCEVISNCLWVGNDWTLSWHLHDNLNNPNQMLPVGEAAEKGKRNN